jgi:hypothetical protein
MEEAWWDSSQQVLGGTFSRSEEETHVLLQVNATDYRFVCEECTGKFCPHASALVNFFLESEEAFFGLKCSESNLAKLSKSSWMKIQSKARRRNTSSLRKKLLTMKDGLSWAREFQQKLFYSLPKVKSQEELFALREQLGRLTEFHLPGLVESFRRLISMDSEDVLVPLVKLKAALDQAEVVLEKQLSSADLKYEDSEIYALLGHVWKITELEELSPGKPGVFLQLAFECRENNYAERLEDVAVWINLLTGELCHSENLRPFKALRHLKAEDSSDDVYECYEFFRYPGKSNARVRWQSYTKRKEQPDDYRLAVNSARADWDAVLREVKRLFRSDVLLSAPLFMLKFESIHSDGERFYIVNNAGDSLKISKEQTTQLSCLLKTLTNKNLVDAAILVEFQYDVSVNEISVKALCLINSYEKVRLVL